jgi:hypothetical protein
MGASQGTRWPFSTQTLALPFMGNSGTYKSINTLGKEGKIVLLPVISILLMCAYRLMEPGARGLLGWVCNCVCETLKPVCSAHCDNRQTRAYINNRAAPGECG